MERIVDLGGARGGNDGSRWFLALLALVLALVVADPTPRCLGIAKDTELTSRAVEPKGQVDRAGHDHTPLPVSISRMSGAAAARPLRATGWTRFEPLLLPLAVVARVVTGSSVRDERTRDLSSPLRC